MKKINPKEVTQIPQAGFLLTAGSLNGENTNGSLKSYNTMTVGWAEIGTLWGVPTLSVLVRSNRYTYEFMEKNDYFTASFFSHLQAKVLSICGSKSGRDVDKAKEAGITPIEIDGNVTFSEAKKILVCKKAYVYDLDKEKFVNKEFLKFYDEPMHRVYVGEIISAYEK
ncbi:MAG: flavin reductase [Ruminococcus sp.]|jgi:flavin reductase (DIM6/NTAB) family NADH-FMN oxidoreductase RutF|nr:flavin reductase [Ruminococcus sp.]